MKIKIRKNRSNVVCARVMVGSIPVVVSVIPGGSGVNMVALDHRSNFDALLGADALELLAAATLKQMGMAAPPTDATIYLSV